MPPFKSEELDRCLVTTPGMLRKVSGCVAMVEMCKYFKGEVKSKEKFHITVGHKNIMADIYLFIGNKNAVSGFGVNFKSENFGEFEKGEKGFELGEEYIYVSGMSRETIKYGNGETGYSELNKMGKVVLVYLHFQKPIFILPFSFYIGSRFDYNAESKMCRIAFSGKTVFDFCEGSQSVNPGMLRLLSEKIKYGIVEKRFDDFTVIVKEMFKKETNLALFVGKEVFFEESDVVGKITGTFGASGKVKVGLKDSFEKVLPGFLGRKVHIINKKYLKLKNV